jgi:outer membrane protease
MSCNKFSLNITKLTFLLSIVLFISLVKTAFAENIPLKRIDKNNIFQSRESGILLETSLENNNGVAVEEVYSNNKKISELKWKFQDILMSRIKLGVIVDDSFSINFSYATSKNNSYKSKMSDYDWLGSSEFPGGDDGNKDHSNWTHYSSSIVKANIKDFDINGNSTFFENYSFKIGFRQQEFNFEDKTQDYVYSCNQQPSSSNTCKIGFRNLSGNFNSENYINYYQRFRIPYIGIGFDKKFLNKKLSFSLYSAYSSAVYAYDRDEHVKRSMTVERYFKNGKYYNIGTNIGYNFHDNFKINLGYEYTKIPLIIGNSNYSFSNGNTNYTSKNTAGIANNYQKISLGLSYLFYLN